MQNGSAESLNARPLNEHLLANLKMVREIIEKWTPDYNTNRSHLRLNGLTPTELATRPDQGQNWNRLSYERGRVGEEVNSGQYLGRICQKLNPQTWRTSSGDASKQGLASIGQAPVTGI
jgi:hypothetical protein